MPVTEVQNAQAFLFGVYPELAGRNVAFTMTPLGRALLVEIAELATGDAARAEAVSRADSSATPLLTATIEFDASGGLVAFSAHGVLVDDARNERLWKEVREHPDWAESDAELWLVGAGGDTTVGRRAPAASRLATEPWTRFLGTAVTADTSRFRWRGDAPPGVRAGRVGSDRLISGRMPDGSTVRPATQPPPALGVRPAWVVEATAMGATGESLRYRLEYEPFGGRLISAVRQ